MSTSPRAEVFSTSVAPCSQEHPRNDHAQIFELQDGLLLIVWSEYYVRNPRSISDTPYSRTDGGDNAPCQLTGKVSRDGGRSWSGRITIQENLGHQNVKQPNLHRLPSGDVILFFTVWEASLHERSVWMKRSSDDCATWTAPVQLTPPGGFYILDAGRIFCHSSGRVILPIVHTPEIWTENTKIRAFCYYSDDGGDSWKASDSRMDVPGRGAMEPTMAETADGSLLTVLRTNQGQLFSATSQDRGETWSTPQETGLASPESEPCLKRLPGTTDLLLLWNNTQPSSANAHRPRNPLSSAISRDSGLTWENIKNINDHVGYSSAYPNVFFRGDEALITYYYTSESMAGVSSLELKIFETEWFLSGEADP